MSDYNFVIESIGKRNLAQLEDLAERSTVPYPTVLKVARGYTKNPKTLTIELLAAAVRRERSPRRRKSARR